MLAAWDLSHVGEIGPRSSKQEARFVEEKIKPVGRLAWNLEVGLFLWDVIM